MFLDLAPCHVLSDLSPDIELYCMELSRQGHASSRSGPMIAVMHA